MSFDGISNNALIEAGLYEPWELTDIPRPGDLWLTIPRSTRYEVNANGEIRNKKSGKTLRPRPLPAGYLRVCVPGDDTYIHTLVLEAFIGPRPDGHQASHRDGKTGNNRPSNLRWETPLENNKRKFEHGTVMFGTLNPMGRKTHCKRGHEFTDENTRRANGKRVCRACSRDWMRNRRAK